MIFVQLEEFNYSHAQQNRLRDIPSVVYVAFPSLIICMIDDDEWKSEMYWIFFIIFFFIQLCSKLLLRLSSYCLSLWLWQIWCIIIIIIIIKKT